MEKGKYIGMPTDYLREESSNCKASEDGDVFRNYRAPKSCRYVSLDLPGRFLRVSCEACVESLGRRLHHQSESVI
jgi:hypothetical protein